MIRILVDHNIEAQALMLSGTLTSENWTDLLSVEFAMFTDMNLPYNSNDRVLWRYAQQNGMLLLTENRNMSGRDSLELTIREENTMDSLPVITIGNVDRMIEKDYRKRCAVKLVEILFDLENYLGTGGFIFHEFGPIGRAYLLML